MLDRFFTAFYLPAVLIFAALLSGCQADPAGPAGDKPAPLLLISIDGFRHDYIERFDSPAIDRMIREGFYADSLHQAFPTKTFATHYTLVTGRHPGTHGVVANNMWDPKREASFSLGDREAVNDGFWYQGGEPIWVTAEQQGLTAATFFWPGSEAMIQRTRPTHYRAYDGRVPHAERIDQVLEWLAMPEEERPDFLTLYFSRVDSRGHSDGPASTATLDAAARIDDELGRLFSELEARGQLDAINIILVSDHGMSEVSRERTVALDEHLDLSKVRVSDWGPAAQLWAGEMSADEIVAALEDADHLSAWQRKDIPERYHFGSHYRVPDVLVEADPGWLISSKPYMANPNPPKGMHGWDPALAEMHGVFVARGPDFTPGSRAPTVRSVSVYPLMAHLLDLEPAENEGRLATFLPYLDAEDTPDYRIERFTCETGTIETRIGPEHMALHMGEFIHVLKRQGPGRFEQVDLQFEIEGDRATGRVDGNALGECQRL
ncbi:MULTISPECIES: ectonucleotide pyrophosphatase/phosphodiesterase [unclassified Wenzhouxiangella]|uniref:alkaline phosphatase family protein n=1 Tax=unclassified Wenzhouxiangella TaxID=2613841 RepID=UPI000E329161|nr:MULTISPECIES: ectonucleotide pyrophosphatase/phosphodiesterase [unclassified Wenzhouxiangella]RFF27439.1 alkaline phosphatase family protein [Wenzhouxiangella sp. 15181]RFP68867.1 alkaline phosphatase family protein [Wenzhouxiangella sp. 15190]